MIACLSLTTYAQEKVTIMGYVIGEYEQALDYVTVAQDGTNNVTYTDQEGFYFLDIKKNEPFKLIFRYVGYKDREYLLPAIDEDSHLDVKLNRIASDLPEVTVEGNTLGTIRQRLNYLTGVKPSNPSIDGGIEGLLVTMGGVNSSNELSTQYSVRGGNFDENMVYVNGIEIYRPLLIRNAQQEGLSFINPKMIKNIDFSTGGFTAEYGDKMSSVLDVGYKKTNVPFEGSATASLLGGDIYIGSSSKAFSQVTGVRYKTTQSLLNTTDTDAEYEPNFIDAQTYMSLNLSDKWEASFLGNYSMSKYNFTPKTRETKFGTIENVQNFKVYFKGWEKDKFITHQAALSLKYKPSEHVDLNLTSSIFGSNEYERYDIGSEYVLREMNTDGNNSTQDPNSMIGIGAYHEHARNDLQSDILTFSHTGQAELGKHKLKWGLSYQKEKINDKINEWEMRDSIGYSQPQKDNLLEVYSNLKAKNNIESTRYSAFLQDSYRMETNSGLFIFNLGVRASHWDFNKETIISPRGVVAFIPERNNNLAFRFSTGIYYQSPFYKEFQKIKANNTNNTIELNKDINSQKSIHFVVGNDLHFRSGNSPFKFTTELYYKSLSNLIPYTVNNVKIRYAGENKSKGYIAGVDFKLYGEFVSGVDSWISLSLMKTEQDIEGKKVPLPTDQQYNISFFFQDYFPGYQRLTMSLKGVYAAGLPFNSPHRGYEIGYFRNPAYKRFDIGFAWQMLGEDFAIRNRSSFWGTFKDIWLGVDIFNLFDMKNTSTHYWITDAYQSQYAVPNYLTGRQLSAKLVVNF